MGDTVVYGELNLFGVDKQEPYFIWGGVVEKAYNLGVKGDGFTRARLPAISRWGIFARSAQNRNASDVLAQSDL